jgi:hypothetical protein
MELRRRMQRLLVLAGVAAVLFILDEEEKNKRGGRPASRKRQRRTVKEVYECLGSIYFRRAYGMSYQTFWVLHSKNDFVRLSNNNTLYVQDGEPILSVVRMYLIIRFKLLHNNQTMM